ncbi:MAG: 4-oxalocrotonate tautomerase [Candidatus Omnitrophota bacterium]|jgi:4-oxalocrotonate tautomerase
MPYVHVRVAGKLTKKQRQEIASQIAQTLKKVANKPVKSTYTVIDEIPRDHWAVGQDLLSDIKH